MEGCYCLLLLHFNLILAQQGHDKHVAFILFFAMYVAHARNSPLHNLAPVL